MSISPPPIQTPIIERAKEAFGFLASEWIQYINQTFTGDTGNSFVATYSGLSTTGTATVTASYYRSGQFYDFEIRIVPGTDTSSVAGTTYFNLPFKPSSDGGCFVKYGTASATAAIDANTSRIYTPTWTAVTVPVMIMGRIRS